MPATFIPDALLLLARSANGRCCPTCSCADEAMPDGGCSRPAYLNGACQGHVWMSREPNEQLHRTNAATAQYCCTGPHTRAFASPLKMQAPPLNSPSTASHAFLLAVRTSTFRRCRGSADLYQTWPSVMIVQNSWSGHVVINSTRP